MGTYRFRWDVIPANLNFLLSGVGMTLLISALTLVLATAAGLLIAAMASSKFWPARALATGFGEIIRNTLILVQLLWVYYVLPILLDIRIDALTACVIGLSIYSSAFIAEVFRAGIQSVPPGHREAARDGTFVQHVPPAGDLQFHRRGVFRYLLASVTRRAALGASPCPALIYGLLSGCHAGRR
jgi:His/Glu/Gln/Arg/opine family amino acid ABC transporter permease subunit